MRSMCFSGLVCVMVLVYYCCIIGIRVSFGVMCYLIIVIGLYCGSLWSYYCCMGVLV